MSKTIYTIKNEIRHSVEIKKSKFIAYTFKCESKEEADAILHDIKE